MSDNNGVWIHKTTYTYSLSTPVSQIETIWTRRDGWGFIKSKDMWVPSLTSVEELKDLGYQEIKDDQDPSVRICPFCGMRSESIPGSLLVKHITACGGAGDEWIKIEDAMIADIRRQQFEAKILAEIKRQKEEEEERERKERFGKIREDALAKQMAKDRKKRLKQEARNALRKGTPVKK